MMDASFLAELRTWAEQARVDFEDRAEWARDGKREQTAEVASLAARTFADLRTICNRRLAAQRARLAEAFEEAVDKRGAIVREHGAWTMIAHYHEEREHAAWQALTDFDAATKGGEG